eukprot:808814-Pleurochrysis_carterae.AAC.1
MPSMPNCVVLRSANGGSLSAPASHSVASVSFTAAASPAPLLAAPCRACPVGTHSNFNAASAVAN